MQSHYANDARWPLAIHEAAHAVVGFLLGLPIECIDIDFDQWNGGVTFSRSFFADEWRRDLLVSLAGEEAQKRVDPAGQSLFDEHGQRRAIDDEAKASQAVSQHNQQDDSEEEDRISEERVREGREAVVALLDMLWAPVEAVAIAIIDGAGHLSRTQVERVIDSVVTRAMANEIVQRIDFVWKEPHSP